MSCDQCQHCKDATYESQRKSRIYWMTGEWKHECQTDKDSERAKRLQATIEKEQKELEEWRATKKGKAQSAAEST